MWFNVRIGSGAGEPAEKSMRGRETAWNTLQRQLQSIIKFAVVGSRTFLFNRSLPILQEAFWEKASRYKYRIGYTKRATTPVTMCIYLFGQYINYRFLYRIRYIYFISQLLFAMGFRPNISASHFSRTEKTATLSVFVSLLGLFSFVGTGSVG